ncbi:MAG: hypothetical protein IJ334_15965, partial [Clostridia bacterium]|nr:hypothetical protein [Clostridia bacterium]
LVCDADLSRADFIEPGSLAENLPLDWPMCCNPDYTAVKASITADPRWDAWVSRCRSSAE